jgi:hypothetical protein
MTRFRKLFGRWLIIPAVAVVLTVGAQVALAATVYICPPRDGNPPRGCKLVGSKPCPSCPGGFCWLVQCN